MIECASFDLPLSITPFVRGRPHATAAEAPQEEGRFDDLLVHEGGGDTYLGNVEDVSYDGARRAFREHLNTLDDGEADRKSKGFTAGELMDLFLDWVK